MIPMPPSPVASEPLSRSPSRRGRSRTRSPINSSRSSSSVVVLRSRSASRASSPSWRLPSGSPCAPPTCVLTPPPVRGPIPPSVCQIPIPGPMIINPPSRSSISIRSRSASRSPRSFYVSTPSGRSRSRSHSPPRYPMPIPPPIPCYHQPPPIIPFLGHPIYSWAPISVVHHPRFYFQDGNVTLEIERIQYKIHRHFLVMSSSVFADELPPSVTSKYLPSDVNKQAFELVLSLFYPKDCFSGHDIQSESDWLKVLIFACRYKMTLIRDMAVTKLPSLDAIVKAELAAKYGLKDWLVPAYTDLCIKNITARKGWSADEGKKIGLGGILALVELKQDIMDHLGEHLDREKVVKTVEEKLKGLNLI
ncbi:hypothetical protein ARMSODRAFT_951426 [Armillaria solidipes]|uniref:BTB domain-containing protein n=1 Tax=Armillaria solidipes TaxID=1076256 RepID=A0A2H3C6G3_9AGAR|nr:hypothetical protein ARMSODRAFT_951426 [Armillaria solidipes]